MTQTSIKSKSTGRVELKAHEVTDGDYLYSPGEDKLILIADDEDSNFHIVDITYFRVHSGNNWEELYEAFIDEHGPFYHVGNLKIRHSFARKED